MAAKAENVTISSQDDKTSKTVEENLLTQKCEKNIEKLKGELQSSEFKNLDELCQFLTKFEPELTRIIGNFLSDSALELSSKIVPPFLTACKSDMEERKRVKEALLPHVFNANPDGIEMFFKKPDAHSKMLLTKTEYSEGYFSQKLNKFICFRNWEGVSPLQAAYLCGDKFIGIKLLAYIVNDKSLLPHQVKNLLLEAQQQLKEILNRAMMQINGINETNNFADTAEYLAPVKELIKAYNIYITQYASLSSENKWAERDKLWQQVGECHKKLPHYVKQEFFTGRAFYPVPSFDTEPSRAECRYWDNKLLNLDKLGIGTNPFCGLYKGWRPDGRAGYAEIMTPIAKHPETGHSMASIDLMAMNHLYKTRITDLRNTINCLTTLEAVKELISNNNKQCIKF